MFITILLSFILIVLVYNYVSNGKKGRLINLIPGPLGYPIVGNTLQLLGSREKQIKKLFSINNQYPICKISSFLTTVVIIRHPDDLEAILGSTKHIEKSFIYNIAKSWVGTGLVTSNGHKWHSRRKILNPTFHFNILQQFAEIFIKESKNMTISLNNAEDTVVKDLISFLNKHTLNAICETAMGISLQDLDAFQHGEFQRAVHQLMDVLIYRLFRLWLHFNWIFSLTPKGREQTKLLKIIHGFTNRIIAERRLYHELNNGQYLKNFDNNISVGEDTEIIKTRRKQIALLDLLIAISHEDLMTDVDIREEVNTFIFAGHDTTAKAICFTLMLLAEHKDIQDRVRNEVDTVMRENEEKLTMKLLQQLPYLERCIKEALRLYPSVPFISRILGEDMKLQSYLVPAGTVMLINIYGVHRDPNFWSHPEIFDPDRFLPENIRNRHLYSYIPFSAGPRSCIGQRFAMLEMKAMIASLVHNFYLEPINYLKNLRLQMDVTLCPTHPLHIRFVPVCKINANIKKKKIKYRFNKHHRRQTKEQ